MRPHTGGPQRRARRPADRRDPACGNGIGAGAGHRAFVKTRCAGLRATRVRGVTTSSADRTAPAGRAESAARRGVIPRIRQVGLDTWRSHADLSGLRPPANRAAQPSRPCARGAATRARPPAGAWSGRRAVRRTGFRYFTHLMSRQPGTPHRSSTVDNLGAFGPRRATPRCSGCPAAVSPKIGLRRVPFPRPRRASGEADRRHRRQAEMKPLVPDRLLGGEQRHAHGP